MAHSITHVPVKSLPKQEEHKQEEFNPEDLKKEVESATRTIKPNVSLRGTSSTDPKELEADRELRGTSITRLLTMPGRVPADIVSMILDAKEGLSAASPGINHILDAIGRGPLPITQAYTLLRWVRDNTIGSFDDPKTELFPGGSGKLPTTASLEELGSVFGPVPGSPETLTGEALELGLEAVAFPGGLVGTAGKTALGTGAKVAGRVGLFTGAEGMGVLTRDAVTTEQNQAGAIPVLAQVVGVMGALGAKEVVPATWKYGKRRFQSAAGIVEKTVEKQTGDLTIFAKDAAEALEIQKAIRGMKGGENFSITASAVFVPMRAIERQLRSEDFPTEQQVQIRIRGTREALSEVTENLRPHLPDFAIRLGDRLDLQAKVREHIAKMLLPLTRPHDTEPLSPNMLGLAVNQAVLDAFKTTREDIVGKLREFDPLTIPNDNKFAIGKLKRDVTNDFDKEWQEIILRDLKEGLPKKSKNITYSTRLDYSRLTIKDLRRGRTQIQRAISAQSRTGVPRPSEYDRLIKQSNRLDEMIDDVANAQLDSGVAEKIKTFNSRYKREIGDTYYKTDLAPLIRDSQKGVENSDTIFTHFFGGDPTVKGVKNLRDLERAIGAGNTETLIQLGFATHLRTVVADPSTSHISIKAIKNFMNKREEVIEAFPRLEAIFTQIAETFGKSGDGLDALALKGTKQLVNDLLDDPKGNGHLLRSGVIDFVLQTSKRKHAFINDLLDGMLQRTGIIAKKEGLFGVVREPRLGDADKLADLLVEGGESLKKILGPKRFEGLSKVQRAMKRVEDEVLGSQFSGKIEEIELQQAVGSGVAHIFASARNQISPEFIGGLRAARLAAELAQKLSNAQLRNLWRKFTGSPEFLEGVAKLASMPVEEAEKLYTALIRRLALQSVNEVPLDAAERRLLNLRSTAAIAPPVIAPTLTTAEDEVPPFLEEGEEPFLMGDPDLFNKGGVGLMAPPFSTDPKPPLPTSAEPRPNILYRGAGHLNRFIGRVPIPPLLP